MTQGAERPPGTDSAEPKKPTPVWLWIVLIAGAIGFVAVVLAVAVGVYASRRYARASEEARIAREAAMQEAIAAEERARHAAEALEKRRDGGPPRPTRPRPDDPLDGL
jgi:hypothetical protein